MPTPQSDKTKKRKRSLDFTDTIKAIINEERVATMDDKTREDIARAALETCQNFLRDIEPITNKWGLAVALDALQDVTEYLKKEASEVGEDGDEAEDVDWTMTVSTPTRNTPRPKPASAKKGKAGNK